MPILLTPALPADLDALVPLVRAYHDFEGIELDDGERIGAVRTLLADPSRGAMWWIEADGQRVGYVAVCFGFSLEFGGRDAFVDELYVVPEARGRGAGRAALAAAMRAAAAHGVRALHLEVGRTNARARALYESLGFDAREAFTLMSRSLEDL